MLCPRIPIGYPKEEIATIDALLSQSGGQTEAIKELIIALDEQLAKLE